MFINENFLLQNEIAKKLYHEYIKGLPIYDYHCHINPKDIYEDVRYNNICEVWLGGDHYKWRAMRSNGIDERYITGDSTDYEKFEKWCSTIPYAVGNPLYHWSHLELKEYFGTDLLLNDNNAKALWEITKDKLNQPEMSVRGIINKSNVKLICTTDDPVDELEYHKKIKEDEEFSVDVLPAFRPDKSFLINKSTFLEWFKKLEKVSDTVIKDFAAYLKVLESRIEYFHSNGCRLSDHALDPISFKKGTREEVESIFAKAIEGKEISSDELKIFITEMIIFYGKEYYKRGWVMQLHIGTMRNNNSKMNNILGPDTGFDAIGDWNFASDLANLLNALDKESSLPKTILYSLNPRDNYTLGTIMGCFQGIEAPGKVQLGSAWWFNDHKEGMEKQLIDLANLGLLGRFIGMTTDSRSFLSYTRHDYFRRILANLVGTWVDEGQLPKDWDMLKTLVQNISYYNAVRYFNMGNVDKQMEI